MASLLKAFSIALFFSFLHGYSQEETVTRDWTSFVQTINMTTDKPLNFKLRGAVKTHLTTDEAAAAILWIRADDKNEESVLYKNSSRPIIKYDEWVIDEITGTVPKNTTTFNFGGYVVYNGDFLYDDFELFIENETGALEKIAIENPSFETAITTDNLQGWQYGTGRGKITKVEGYQIDGANDAYESKKALNIVGDGVQKIKSRNINMEEGYTPQIGAMVAMLNNLSNRVERIVKDLDLRQTDHLLDEKANSIGALVMHLAAAEAYYQVNTFENREFNKEEEKQWMVGLELDEKGRQNLKGHEISYYLDIYKKTREKTLAELKKRNDKWLEQINPGSWGNNHFKWFHVMEHQSSHLGQILMLKKRLPEKETKVTLPEENVD